ncbi:MBL fold metallo-hydrolase [Gemmatimonadetes bacterium T265]|nr:MBL fold metallo-hydrolase [Gemmatimonadetes bacterium T265]
MRLTFLGTGTSFGIPQIGCGCAVCHSPDPRDRRSRVGALVETDAGRRILIDTPPELRLQLVAAGVGAVDAVLFTHDHADHTHGIDDLRAFSAATGRAVPAYASAETAAGLVRKFAYIFDDAMKALPGTYKPEGHLKLLEPWVPAEVAGEAVTPVVVPHGHARVFGYRIGPLGYVTDAKVLPDDAVRVLRGVRVLVLNALFHRPHPTHLSISEAVEAARRVGAARTYLTHLTHHTSHASLEDELPPDVRPAYDGLVVEV